jgi:hypothetical protein
VFAPPTPVEGVYAIRCDRARGPGDEQGGQSPLLSACYTDSELMVGPVSLLFDQQAGKAHTVLRLVDGRFCQGWRTQLSCLLGSLL